jgi:hypothetical protein
MRGQFTFGPVPQKVTIAGVAAAGAVQWVVNGTPLPNNGSVPLNPGDTVTFTVQSGMHGLTFLNKADAEKVFGPLGAPFKAQPGIGPTAWGTPGQAAGTTLATLTVQAALPAGLTSLAFECTVHKQNMAGSFTFGPVKPARKLAFPVGDWTRAINYRTEPFGYRFAQVDWSLNDSSKAPLGIAPALADILVLADPETPVFVAAAGTPVRFRMLHPAGTSNDQVMTLHGHVWQEEPYTTDSTVIGNNPLSQWMGSRDAFGPNVSFDLVLEKAGGKSGVLGDYLYRTFIGNDFQFGLWGILRVGRADQDTVTITSFSNTMVTGHNTVNPDTGQMADKVMLFSGTGATPTQIGTATVDKMRGTWSFTGINLRPPLTVKSTLGGGAMAEQLITRFKEPEAPRGMTSSERDAGERTRFLPTSRSLNR